jgi:hypothetical protein
VRAAKTSERSRRCRAPGAASLLLLLVLVTPGGGCSGNLAGGNPGSGSGGAGGSTIVDAGPAPASDGGAAADGGAADAAPQLRGYHAFDVSTSIDTRVAPVVAMNAANGERVSLPVPTSQSFTLVVDADTGAVFVGSQIRYATSSDGRTFRVQGAFEVYSAGSHPALSYRDAVLTIAGNGLTGGATVTVNSANGWESPPSVLTLGLNAMTGRPDTTPPAFQWYWSGPMDPMRDFDLFATEPLPPNAQVRFEDMSGNVIATFPYYPTPPAPLSGNLSAPIFERHPVVLAYGATYRLVTSSLTDFAGNRAAPLEFTTLPTPPLVAQDGFESAAAGSIAGGEIVGGSGGLPAIAGGKSLFVPGRKAGEACQSGSISDMVVRLTIPPVRRQIRWSFRTVMTGSGGLASRDLSLGSVGGTPGQSAVTGVAPFTTVTLPDGTSASLSAVGTRTMPLPGLAQNELVFAVGSSCPLTQDVPGVLLDDLVIE